jgi:phosphoribosylamine--glycine ligase
MGTVVTYRGAERMFEASLARLAPMLRDSAYCGYVNLNTIVNEEGIWPLELTCRFGYPGFPILDSLHRVGWDGLFRTLVGRTGERFATHDGYSVGVVITVPPFPYSHGYETLGKGRPICFADDLSEDDRRSLHYGEVDLRDGRLVTAGLIGYIMVVTAVAETIEDARDAAYRRVKKVVIPNARYRDDIGVRLLVTELAQMRALGLVP